MLPTRQANESAPAQGPAKGEFLLSVDLEDVRDWTPEGPLLRERVPVMTEQVLTLLRAAKAKITFFVTGQLALRYKSILRDILAKGHELACHTFSHKPLAQYGKTEFEDDLKRNLDALAVPGTNKVCGFRAPVLSMTPQSAWAYSILAKNGITYSSSVLPGGNPLFGWPDFGEIPKAMYGVLEIPVSVCRVLGVGLPFASGVTFVPCHLR